MKTKGEKINKAVKIIVGVLLVLLGCLFVARPVVTTVLAVFVAGIILLVLGGVELVVTLLPHNRAKKHKAGLVTGLFKISLGALILLLDPTAIAYFPLIAASFLAVFGIYRIWLGSKRKKVGEDNWATSTGIGVIALAGAVMLAFAQWLFAMEMVGVLIAAIAILYGFVVLLDAFVPARRETEKQEEEESKAISEKENEAFRQYQERLKK